MKNIRNKQERNYKSEAHQHNKR